MKNRIHLFALATLFTVALFTAYSGKAVPNIIAAATAAPTSEPAAANTVDPANFVSGVNHPYFPVKPGTTYIYEGKTEKGNEHVEVVLKPETKVIMGVSCVAVEDTVKVDGELEEATTDWYAQDRQGNVWYFGEDTKEYQNGKVASTKGAWEAGVNGAKPGYIMKAKPVLGDIYRQEYYKGEAEDMAAVFSLSGSASVPTGSYQNVLVTTEWSALSDPLVFERKYYAKGVGLVLVKYVDSSYELKLIEIRHP
jgi:hypothetical protein